MFETSNTQLTLNPGTLSGGKVESLCASGFSPNDRPNVPNTGQNKLQPCIDLTQRQRRDPFHGHQLRPSFKAEADTNR